MQDAEKRRMNILGYGLKVVPVVAWVLTFVPLYYATLADTRGRVNWFSDALLPSLLVAVGVGVVCYAVWYGYKQFVLKKI